MNIFKRQSICIHLLFGLSNMDFEERNFWLPFTRAALQKKSWALVHLIGDDSIAGKLCKKTSEIVIFNLRSSWIMSFYLHFFIIGDTIVLNGNKKGGKLSGDNCVKAIYLGSIMQGQLSWWQLFWGNYVGVISGNVAGLNPSCKISM